MTTTYIKTAVKLSRKRFLTATSEGIDLKGPLFNLLKKMTGDGTIAESGEGNEKTYSLVHVESVTNEHELTSIANSMQLILEAE